MPFAVLHVKANAFITARVCGKGEVNVPFAVLHFKGNALTARVCGKEEVNVPFAVFARYGECIYYRARLRQGSGKRAVCGFACYGECFNRTRLRQKRQTYRLRFALYGKCFYYRAFAAKER